MLNFQTYINENAQELFKEPTSLAAREAKKLGLEYFGFGRYGKNSKVTHIVHKERLVKNPSDNYRELDKIDKERSKYSNYFGLKGNPKISKQKVKELDKKEKEYNDIIKSKDKSEDDYKKFLQIEKKRIIKDHKALNNHFDWNNLKENERTTIEAYAGDDYMLVNKMLNKFKGNDEEFSKKAKGKDSYTGDKHVKALVADMDNVLDNHELPQDTIVYSGVSKHKMIQGETYILPAYRSTSLDIEMANDFATSNRSPITKKNQLIQFNLKRGQKGFYVPGENSTLGETQQEYEFILPRNFKFKLLDKPRIFHNPNTGEISEIFIAEPIDDFDIEVKKDKKENWSKPKDENIKQEYETEYKNHFKYMFGDIFPTLDSWKKAIKKGKVVEITPEMDQRIENRSKTMDKKELHKLIKGYKSYPKHRNEDTLNNLYDRLKNKENLDMPLVFKDKYDNLSIVAGNTRMDAAFHSKINPKVIVFEELKTINNKNK
ncbi:MAG: ADP-ribosyltransferase [Candidatus Paceibacterota bacterium]